MSYPPTSGGRRVLGHLDDLVWLVLVVFAFPVAIIAIGAPVALLARLIAEIWQRL